MLLERRKSAFSRDAAEEQGEKEAPTASSEFLEQWPGDQGLTVDVINGETGETLDQRTMKEDRVEN